ncbi:MAG: carbamoyltransferase C-terminal domain-containing protein [Acidobacteriota bacterium]
MITLGLIDTKPSTAAVLDDGEIMSAVAEERLCRWKLAGGMPRAAIDHALSIAGIPAAAIDGVVVAQNTAPWQPEPVPFSGWFDDPTRRRSRFLRLGAELAPWVGRFSPSRRAHHRLKSWVHRERRHRLPASLAAGHGITAPVRFVDHHDAHAASAYGTCDLEPCLVVTLDGGGDGRSGSVAIGRGGRLEPVASVDSYHSLGNVYSYVTELCGFRAEKHEGKITGLAALGTPRFADILRRFVRYAHPGRIRYGVAMYHRSALRRLRAALPADFEPLRDRADLAASVQLVLEEVAIGFVRHWLQRTGLRHLAVAGGVFANVKLNQRLVEMPEIDRLWVHPAMDDGGLAVGGALLAAMDRPDPLARKRRLPDVYLGPDVEDGHRDVTAGVADARARGFVVERFSDPNALAEAIAGHLADGRTVARCTGRMEYGPRALGHRSVLHRADDPTIHDRLNRQLRRTEFMPFAPATLAEHATERYRRLDVAADAARFMTVTFEVTERLRAESPAAVHVDGTARPQIVDGDTAPDLHRLLSAYHRRTGVPTVLNTSFNLHEEPIVATADDAVRAFVEADLDVLALGEHLIRRPTEG